MKFAGCATALAGLFLAFPVDAAPVAKVVYHTAYFTSGTPQWEDAPLSGTFSETIMASIPRAFGTFSMIGIQCAIMTDGGKLRSCKISVEPDDVTLTMIAKRMAAEIRVDHVFAKRNRLRIKFVGFQIRVSNSDIPVTSGPCWPPRCHYVPAPPPPPS